MDTERYCTTPDNLDRVKALRAIHQALLQLSAVVRNCDVAPYDCAPALSDLASCLKDAGHMGFAP